MIIMCLECLAKRIGRMPEPDRVFQTEHSYYCQWCGAYRPAARYIDWQQDEDEKSPIEPL